MSNETRTPEEQLVALDAEAATARKAREETLTQFRATTDDKRRAVLLRKIEDLDAVLTRLSEQIYPLAPDRPVEPGARVPELPRDGPPPPSLADREISQAEFPTAFHAATTPDGQILRDGQGQPVWLRLPDLAEDAALCALGEHCGHQEPAGVMRRPCGRPHAVRFTNCCACGRRIAVEVL